MDEKLSYTTIIHNIRKKLKLSLMEYCIADSIYHLSNNPESKVIGWCYASKETMADFLGTTSKTIYKNIPKLIKKGLVEKDEYTRYLRTTQKWYNNVVLIRIKTEYNQTSQSITKGYSGVLPKVIPDYNQRLYYNNKDNNKDNNKRETPSQKMIKFINSDLKEYSDKFNCPISELEKFRSYWTEPNKSGSKTRWELEKTFDLDRRVRTWLDRANQYSKEEKRSAGTFDIRKI